MVLEDIAIQNGELQMAVDRILQSEGFRNSEVVRRLLSYLTEKVVSGEADTLKEYTVAVEALGKPPSYDPQRNSTVRIQVGRLRQKLAEYYLTEGKDNEVIVALPKGHFRLTCAHRPFVEETRPATFLPVPDISQNAEVRPRPRISALALVSGLCAGIFLSTCVFLIWHGLQRGENSEMAAAWTSDLETLWSPFVNSKLPLILSIEDPLFAEVRTNPPTYFRDHSLNEWKAIESAPAVKRLTDILGKSPAKPSRYFTSFGEADASFRLGQLLGAHKQVFGMVRTSQLSWEQLADNNVLFVGVQTLYFQQLQGMPIVPELIANEHSIRNIHPAPGELALYLDQQTVPRAEQGIVYALVTHVPGPRGSNDIQSFASTRSPGYVGAVQFFTDPKSARIVVNKLKEKTGGEMPRFYQVLLKVTYRDDVPTETTYVLSRALR